MRRRSRRIAHRPVLRGAGEQHGVGLPPRGRSSLKRCGRFSHIRNIVHSVSHEVEVGGADTIERPDGLQGVHTVSTLRTVGRRS